MIDKLRRHAALLVLAIFGWLVWSALSPETGEKKAEAKARRYEFEPQVLVVRPADDAPLELPDPFHFVVSGKSSGGGSAAAASAGEAAGRKPAAPDSTPADPHEMASAWVGSLRVLGHDLARYLDGERAPVGGPSAAASGTATALAAAGPAPPAPPRAFEMLLESTLASPDGGQARICGRTAGVGETLDWLDPQDPPRLVAVSGTSATVVRGTDIWVLDLLDNARIVVGGDGALAQAVKAAGEAAARAPRTTPRTTPRAQGGAAAANPRAPAPKPASGGSNGYRKRSYPGKPK